MKNNILLLILCSLFAAPLPALAQYRNNGAPAASPMSYTYADGRIVLYEPDGGGNLDGVRFGGSVLFRPDLFAVGSITAVGDSGYDLTLIDLGVGYRTPLSSVTDLVGIAGLVLAQVDAGPFDDDDTGISLTGGVRSRVGPQFELGGYANYTEVFSDGDVSLIGEALLHVTPQLSLATSLSLSDDVNVLTFGARWNFRNSYRS